MDFDISDLLNDMEKLKISALSKVKIVNNSVKCITIGPNSSPLTPDKDKPDNQKNTRKRAVPSVETASYSPPLKHIYKELELERQKKVEEATKARLKKFNEHSKQLEDERRREFIHKQNAFIEDMERKEMKIIQELEQYDAKKSDQQATLVQHYRELEQQRKKQEEQIKEKEQQRRILNTNIESIRIIQKEFNLEYQKIHCCLKMFIKHEELKNFAEETNVVVKRLLESFEDIINRCLKCDINESDVQIATELLNSLKLINVEAINLIEDYKKKQQENRKLAEEKIRAQLSKDQQVESQQPDKNVAEIVKPTETNKKIQEYVSLRNLKMYTDIMDIFEKHTNSYRDLLNDNTLKQFKFDCKKAINIPVNAISAVNTEHLLDKYVRLYKLLSGQTVIVNDKQVNASQHPEGVAFCMDLLASKFVLQGDLMISSQPEAAFCYATIIVSLWNDFPQLGNLVLAHFYKSCPYLVPYYVPRNVDENDEEFYKRQGYQYNNNGEIEKQDKFLKRMTGIVRLYAAILITKPKHSQNGVIPHNLKNGWRLLASILKLEPRVDITATVLHTFLETVGFEMETKYGKMFKKLMIITIQQFLPKCKKKSTGGAFARLELLLNEYLKKGRFDQPVGYTPNTYW